MSRSERETDDGQGVSDQTLWEWIDEGSEELAEHLRKHPEDAARASEIERTVAGCRRAPDEARIPRTRPGSAGRFRLLSQIGKGGMGVVFEAEQESPRRRVAVKLLRDVAFDDDEVARRLAREAEALGRLAHPNIATVYEHGVTESGEPYLAMERIVGVPLDRWAATRRTRAREIVRLMETVARAVHHAHERGIVHRDLKPSNVLVQEDGQPKVLDFGLAHLASTGATGNASLTLSGRLLGTPAYMSPEQAKGEPETDPRSDVYTLGVILFELLSGALPYDLSARSLPEGMRVIAEDPPLRLGRLDRRLSGDLDLITAKALEKDPRHRYPSAAAFAEDLRRHLGDLPILASRPRPWQRFLRFTKRHPLRVAAGVLILTLASFTAYAATFNVELGSLREITGNWPWIKSPFDGLAWDRDRPLVKVNGAWHELVQVEDLDAAYIVGYCKQHAGERWRKRFREDLVQVLHRMGAWSLWSVDLVVRDLETSRERVLKDVPLSREKRRDLQARHGRIGRLDWEWAQDGIEVDYRGDTWNLRRIGPLTEDELRRAAFYEDRNGARKLTKDLDSLFLRLTGDVLPFPARLELRHPRTGEVVELADVEDLP